MATALITGATGQDGSYLCELLDSHGWLVYAVSRDIDATTNDLPPNVIRRSGDLLRIDEIDATIRAAEPDVIFNLAGISSVAESWRQPELTSRVVGAAVAGILDTALRLQDDLGRPVRVVQASSSEIFGRADHAPQNEATPMRPVSPYGAAKAFAQDLLRIYRNRGLFAASAIFFNHESPRRPATFVTRKISAGVAAIVTGRLDHLTLGNLDARRDWGWAPDYVRAMLAIATAETASDYVVATGESHTVREFVNASFRAAGLPAWERYLEIDNALVRPDDALEMRGDSTQIRTELGWSPTKRFDDVVAAMVAADLAAAANA